MIGQITDESLYGVLSDQSCVISITVHCDLVLSIIVCYLHQTRHCVIYIYIRSEGCFWIMAKFGWQIVLLTGRGEVSWLNLIGC